MENQITITLNPFILQLPVKQQLKKTYDIIRNGFKTGAGCLEFTKNGNVHFHIKTQDDEPSIIAFLDSLKMYKTKINDKKTPIFGFTHISETKTEKKKGNYDYILEDSEKTRQTLKKLKLEQYDEFWEYNGKIVPPKIKQNKIDLRSLISLDNGINLDSDTDLWIRKII